MITEHCTLFIGIDHNGKTHKDVVVRPSKVRDSIEAEKESAGKGNTYYHMACLSRQIISIGSIPQDEITTDFLIDNLWDDDLTPIENARKAIQKKIAGSTTEKKSESSG